MYDLTQLLTTIAAASASIVAILGGFIASKLISIGTERDAISSKIAEVEQSKKHKQSELSAIQDAKTEDAAIDFISTNIESLVEEKALEDVYRQDIQQEITKNDLTPYWSRALSLFRELINCATTEDALQSLNEDHLPKEIAVKYANDNFAYSVCKKAMKYLIQQSKKGNALYAILNRELNIGEIGHVSSVWETERMKSLMSELSWLEYQGQQLQHEKKRLKKPKGMRAGLILFALFSVSCIIFPLSLVPLCVENYCVFVVCKVAVIAVFSLGLIAIFCYLVFLLNWKDDKRS